MDVHPALAVRHDVEWGRCRACDLGPAHEASANLLQAAREERIPRIELDSALICIRGVGQLIVTRLVQSAQVLPDLGDERVDADCARVGVESVVILADVEVEHANAAPVCRILAVPVHGLLVSLVCLSVVMRLHERPPEYIPRERVLRVWEVHGQGRT